MLTSILISQDKWKTLVKTAQIAPQQRRGVEIPEELLERVTRAHAFWSAQAAKDERLTDADGPPRIHYIRVPQPARRPVSSHACASVLLLTFELDSALFLSDSFSISSQVLWVFGSRVGAATSPAACK